MLRARHDTKAVKPTGGGDSPKAPSGRNTHVWVMDQGRANVFLTYRTNAVAACQALAGLLVAAVLPGLRVGAAFGVAMRQGGSANVCLSAAGTLGTRDLDALGL